ncbi:MAG: hypothetical protein OJF51_000870 [Nitrospira sp.]|nr:MAG: hypothetical protein OJF51_000870 [Nitrospira sp.]
MAVLVTKGRGETCLVTQGGRGTQEFFHSLLENADGESDHSSNIGSGLEFKRMLNMRA